MHSNPLINYHPTDADADLAVKYIVKDVDNYIEWLATRPFELPKIIREYKDREGMFFNECCKTNLEEIFADEWKGDLNNTIVTPSEEGAWGEVKEMSLDEYLDNHSDNICGLVDDAGFINHWIEDLVECNIASFAELMIKINIRLAVMLNSRKWTIRDEMISRVYYHLHDHIEKHISGRD